MNKQKIRYKLNKMASHVNILDLDLSKLDLGKSGRTIKLLYNKAPLQLVTSKMYTPFGVKVHNNDYSSFTNCHIDSSLSQGASSNSLTIAVALDALDNRIVELIKSKSNLFKDASDVDFCSDVSTYYSPFLKPNKTYPKLMKISLPRDKNGNFDFVLFDESKNKVPLDDKNIEEVLCKGRSFKGIIECSKLWYYKGKFGSTWNLVQLRFSPKNSNADPDEEESIGTIKQANYTSNIMLDD
jgi:hypothetical protein